MAGDIEDYDDLEEYIRDQLENGIEITAEDFEGKDCAHCAETIPFTEFPEGVVTWDIRVHDPDEPEPEPYYARYYYCSEECKRENAYVAESKSDPDRIHVDDIEDDEQLIADGGQPTEGSAAGGSQDELEDAVPPERKHLNGLVDKMDEWDADAHREGRHEPGEYDDCPLCQEVTA